MSRNKWLLIFLVLLAAAWCGRTAILAAESPVENTTNALLATDQDQEGDGASIIPIRRYTYWGGYAYRYPGYYGYRYRAYRPYWYDYDGYYRSYYPGSYYGPYDYGYASPYYYQPYYGPYYGYYGPAYGSFGYYGPLVRVRVGY